MFRGFVLQFFGSLAQSDISLDGPAGLLHVRVSKAIGWFELIGHQQLVHVWIRTYGSSLECTFLQFNSMFISIVVMVLCLSLSLSLSLSLDA